MDSEELETLRLSMYRFRRWVEQLGRFSFEQGKNNHKDCWKCHYLDGKDRKEFSIWVKGANQRYHYFPRAMREFEFAQANILLDIQWWDRFGNANLTDISHRLPDFGRFHFVGVPFSKGRNVILFLEAQFRFSNKYKKIPMLRFYRYRLW